jgi:hypothetical protein
VSVTDSVTGAGVLGTALYNLGQHTVIVVKNNFTDFVLIVRRFEEKNKFHIFLRCKTTQCLLNKTFLKAWCIKRGCLDITSNYFLTNFYF